MTESWPVWTAHGPRPKSAQPALMFAALSETGKKTDERTSCERPALTQASLVLSWIASAVWRSGKGDAASTCSAIFQSSVM
eukprot:1191055-Prymnesium_polylepis.1